MSLDSERELVREISEATVAAVNRLGGGTRCRTSELAFGSGIIHYVIAERGIIEIDFFSMRVPAIDGCPQLTYANRALSMLWRITHGGHDPNRMELARTGWWNWRNWVLWEMARTTHV